MDNFDPTAYFSLLGTQVLRNRLLEFVSGEPYRWFLKCFNAIFIPVIAYRTFQISECFHSLHTFFHFFILAVVLYKFYLSFVESELCLFFSPIRNFYSETTIDSPQFKIFFLDMLVVISQILLIHFTDKPIILISELGSILYLIATYLLIVLTELLIFTSILLIQLLADMGLQETRYSELNVPVPETECSICKIDYEGDDMVKLLKCNHLFHKECIDQWFEIRKACPLCKMSILQSGETLYEILSPCQPAGSKSEGYFIWS